METTERKKMLFIAPSPLYVEKGSSLRMYAIAEMLSEKYDIDLVTYSTGREFFIKNAVIHRTSSFFKPSLAIGKPSLGKIMLDFLMYIKIIRLSLFKKYDVIHCEDFEGIALGYFSAWLNRKSYYVYDLHNRILDNLHLKSRPKKFRDNLFLFLEKKFIYKCDKVIINWAKYEDQPFLKNKPHFLFYDPINREIDQIKVPNCKYIVYSGNFEEYQGLSDFIPVFLKVNTQLKLYLIGKPSDKIINLIKGSNCEDKVVILGRKSIQETNAYIKGAVYGILPRREGSCMKAIHYMLCNAPVIAKDTLSNREIVKHSNNGYLYKNDDELEALLKQIPLEKNSDAYLSTGVEITKNSIIKIWNEDNFLSKYES